MGRKYYVMLLLVACLSVLALTAAARLTDQRGKSFLLPFFPNLNPGGKVILIVTSQQNATIYVNNPSDPGSDEYREYAVQSGRSVHVTLEGNVAVSTNQVAEKKAVLVIASHPVSVYSLCLKFRTSDGYTAIPVEALGTRYVVATSNATDSQLVVAAAEDDTEVTVEVRVQKSTKCGDVISEKQASALIHFRLQAQEALRVQCNGDITGSVVTSTKPVAVISGNTCANVPLNVKFCDMMVEMMVPVTALGTRYLLHTFQGRTSGAIFRVVPGYKGTQINYGPGLHPHAIGDLPYQEFTLAQDQTGLIIADEPIMVVGFMLGSESGSADELGDPMMTLLPSPDLAPADYLLDLDLSDDAVQTFDCYVTAVVKDEFGSGVFLGNQTLQMQPVSNGLSIGVKQIASWPLHLFHSQTEASIAAVLYCLTTGSSIGFPVGHTVSDFTGEDECASSPCAHEGICHGVGSSYLCHCLGVFGGQLCQEDVVDECQAEPCSNGGECQDGVQSFTCTCPSGYTGVLCEEVIESTSGETSTDTLTTTAAPTESTAAPAETTAAPAETTAAPAETTAATTEDSPVPSPPPPPRRLCPCSCREMEIIQSVKDNQEEAQQKEKERLEKIKEELTVDAKNTSKQKNRHQSASDSRTSATGIGIIGATLLVIVLGLIVFTDIATLASYLISKIQSHLSRPLKAKADSEPFQQEEAAAGEVPMEASSFCLHPPLKPVSSVGSDSSDGAVAQMEVSRFVETMAMEGSQENLVPQHRSSMRKHLLHVRPETILLHVRGRQGVEKTCPRKTDS